MKPFIKKRNLTLALLLTTLFSSAAAHADTLTVTLTDPIQTVHPGDTSVLFSAIIVADAANTGDIFLNSTSYSVDGPMVLDDIYMFLYFPQNIPAGQSFLGYLFAVYPPGNQPAGHYLGSFTILGGSGPSAQDPLGTVNFEIDSIANPSSIPEPSTFLLLGTGLIAFTRTHRRVPHS